MTAMDNALTTLCDRPAGVYVFKRFDGFGQNAFATSIKAHYSTILFYQLRICIYIVHVHAPVWTHTFTKYIRTCTHTHTCIYVSTMQADHRGSDVREDEGFSQRDDVRVAFNLTVP